MATVPLSRPYPTRNGLARVRSVDPAIFRTTYFAACMDCTDCYDTCCQYGAGVELETVERIRAHADALEAFVGIARERWFAGEVAESAGGCPGGPRRRTAVVDGSCVFLNRKGRGCLLHRVALENGLDVRQLKPMVCSLFPVLWWDEVLGPPGEIEDGTLVCLGPGPTLYRSARTDLGYYFGAALVAELDALEAAVLAVAPPCGSDPSRTSLPLVAVGVAWPQAGPQAPL